MRTTLDPARTRRALSLNVTPLADGRYRVAGGQAPHSVTTAEVPWECDCADARYGSAGRCKHVVAVYFDRQLDSRVRDALQTALEAT